MQKMKLFIDTHDKANGTFPADIDRNGFTGVYAQYAEACEAEGVVLVNTLINAADGRMYCLNMAKDADAIRRAHNRVGLVFDTITEVATASPGDIYFGWK